VPSSWLPNRLLGSSRSQKSKPKNMAKTADRLRLEPLEERCLLALQVINSFPGMSFAGIQQGLTPPDTHIAVGTKFVVEGVNASIEVFDKSGNMQSVQTIGQFFSPLGTSNSSFLSDPYILWDDYVNRFYVMDLDVQLSAAGNEFSDILLAVSNDASPADGFGEMHRIHINNTDLFDYDKAGFNKDALVIMTNVFPATGNLYESLVTIDKSTILDNNNQTFTDYLSTQDNTNFNMWPAQMHGAATGAPLYFISEDGNQQGSQLRVISMTNELSNSPTFTDTNIPVNPYTVAPGFVDPGGVFSGFDSRTLSADWRNNMLVTTQIVGTTDSSGPVAKSRFYQFSTAGTPSLVQQGEIDQNPGDFTYMGSVTQDNQGNLAMTFLQSSATQFMSMYVTSQSTDDPSGTIDTPVEVAAGQAPEFGGRIGDYSASVLDPVDGTFWVANEFATPDDLWGTEIAHIKVGKGAVIKGEVFSDVNDDGTNDPGDPGIPGITVFIDKNNDGTLDPGDPTAVSDVNGNYTFNALSPGQYTVRAIVPFGDSQTTNPPIVSVGFGDLSIGHDIGLFQNGVIAGQVLNDLTGSGVLVPGDPPLPGFKIEIENLATQQIVRSQLSDAGGNFNISNLPPGSYQVKEIPLAGYTVTTPNPQDVTFSKGGSFLAGIDFGNFKNSTFSGEVFQDTNSDGILDQADAGLTGWQVDLVNVNTSAIVKATTLNDGTYSFPGVPAGTYSLQVELQAGFIKTTLDIPNQQSLSGANITGLNFGVFQLGTVSGNVFNDLNAKGAFQNGDPGLAGWTVNLVNVANNNTVGTATDANGNFSFPAVFPGTFAIQEMPPGGWIQTTPAPANYASVSGGSDSGVSFGNFKEISISGKVFEDFNGNGILDPNDVGISNIPVDLVNAATKQVITTVTPAADGTFTFPGLVPGSYALQEELPAGWVQTTTTPAAVTAVSGQNVTGDLFGNFQNISITGLVFQDNNADGIEDGADAGLQGWTAQLTNITTGKVITTTTSDVNGSFTFPGLAVGTYGVTVVPQSGWVQTTTTPANVIAVSGSNITQSAETFGEFHSGSISGQVFLDNNGDGILNGTDAGVNNITVQLVNVANSKVVNTATTDVNGNYTFNGALFGNYTVQISLPAGYVSTTAGSASISITGSGQGITVISFGIFQLGSISGQVFTDINGDGQKNGNDSGLAGVTVQLLNGSNQVVTSSQTDTNGNVSFGGLRAGTYLLKVLPPSGFFQTTTLPASITINSGTNSAGTSFGVFQFGTISGQVFSDLNDTGSFVLGDPGFAGVQVTMSKSGTLALFHTTTDASGNFSFGNLTAGIYQVTVTTPTGLVSTTAAPGSVVISSGTNATGQAFGFFQRGQVGGRVFNDSYGDGIEQPTMAGLPGYTINLFKVTTGGPVAAGSTTTASDGTYSFTGLAAGSYLVKEVTKTGQLPTFPAGLSYSFSIVSGSNFSGKDFGDIGSANRSFVFQVYHDLLHRTADHGGMDFWAGKLDAGTARSVVVTGIEGSTEYLTDEINGYYETYLHRPVDPIGLQGALALLGNQQLVPGGGTLFFQVQANILGSAEYFQNRGGSTNAGFLSALYLDVLGRPIDPAGASIFGNALKNGATRTQVAKAVLFSGESLNRIVNSDYVALLHRNADPSGLANFASALQQGTSNDAIVGILVSSNEYFQDL
jgi:uncharacterized protein (DUF2141 family)